MYEGSIYEKYDGYQRLTEADFWERDARRMWPEAWETIDAERAAQTQREREAVYIDPYMQATGEFLEYVCGYPLPNPLTGDTV